MGNKEWDNHLRDLLGDFRSEGEPSHWEEIEHQLDTNSDPGDSAERLQDEILKDKLSSYSPPDQVTGWERIEASLNASSTDRLIASPSTTGGFGAFGEPRSA